MKPNLIKHYNKVLYHAAKDVKVVLGSYPERSPAPEKFFPRLWYKFRQAVGIVSLEETIFHNQVRIHELQSRVAGNIPHWVPIVYSPEAERYYVSI